MIDLRESQLIGVQDGHTHRVFVRTGPPTGAKVPLVDRVAQVGCDQRTAKRKQRITISKVVRHLHVFSLLLSHWGDRTRRASGSWIE
jgi:hypothetical protein